MNPWEGARLLHKPFAGPVLLRAVRATLSGEPLSPSEMGIVSATAA